MECPLFWAPHLWTLQKLRPAASWHCLGVTLSPVHRTPKLDTVLAPDKRSRRRDLVDHGELWVLQRPFNPDWEGQLPLLQLGP